MFSVVIPSYNHAPYLPQAVLSALRSPWVSEVLVVDDGSTDDSADQIARLAASHPRRIRDLTGRSDGNRGAHERLNQLVAAARCEWVAVLNSDDAFTPGRFELLRQRCRDGVEFVCGQLLIMDERGRAVGTKRGVEQPEYPFPRELDVPDLAKRQRLAPLLANQNFVATTSNAVFTRALHERLGGFRAFHYVHDWDFALRASLLGRCLYVPHFLSLYRSHPANSIKTDPAAIEAEVRRLMADVREDFPMCGADRDFAAGLAGNRYL